MAAVAALTMIYLPAAASAFEVIVLNFVAVVVGEVSVGEDEDDKNDDDVIDLGAISSELWFGLLLLLLLLLEEKSKQACSLVSASWHKFAQSKYSLVIKLAAIGFFLVFCCFQK